MGCSLGWVRDAQAKGSSFDDLTSGGVTTVPPPVRRLPADRASATPGREVAEKAAEMRGGRATAKPTIRKHAPTAGFDCNAYPEIVLPTLYMALGKTSRTGGPAPAAFTDTIEPMADSSDFLPGAHLAVERDGLFEQVAGWKPSSVTLSLPLEENGTIKAEGSGLYLARPVAPTWPSSTAYLGEEDEWIFQLRDAFLYEGGSSTSVECLRNATLTLSDLQKPAEPCNGKNREWRTVNGHEYPVWHNHKIRAAARRTATLALEFSGTDRAREEKADVLAAEELVLEIEARKLGTTPSSVETLRITAHHAAWSGGGPNDATRDDDINTPLEFGIYLDPASNKDITIEYLNDKATSPVLVPAA